MVDQTASDDEGKSASSTPSTRGKFPRNSLNEALNLVKVVQDLGNGVEIRRVSAFKELGRSSESGASKTLVASATRGYGLLKTTQQGTFFQPTPQGTALVTADNEAAKLAHAWRIMSSNVLFQEFISRWANKPLPPIDEAAIDALKQSAGLSESDAKACYKIFIDNLSDYGLIETIGGKRVVIPPDHLPDVTDTIVDADDSELEADDLPEGEMGNGPAAAGSASTAQQLVGNLAGQIQPQIAFNIQIQLPGDASQETYEAIFKNISVHLLGRSEE